MEVDSIYSNFAYVYDKLTYDINYTKWTNYIEKIFKLHELKPSLVLDLGCGTGSFCIEMSKKGYDMIGIDSSEDMLSCASEKSVDAKNILYIKQDMTDFELYGTVDVVVCLLDSINYILYKNDLKRLLKRVHNYLNPGGLFIFDINTPYKFQNILKGNVFYDISDEITYIWQNYYDAKKKICEFDLTFFIKESDIYNRYDEIHYERCYAIDEISQIIEKSGLDLLKKYDDLRFCPPYQKSERVFFVCRKNT